MIITTLSQKGGVGKSTVLINMALGIAGLKESPTVALVDCDPQRTCEMLLKRYNSRGNFTLYAVDNDPHVFVKTLKEQFIFIDTASGRHRANYLSAAVSDLIVIPVRPAPADILSLGATVADLKKIPLDLDCRFLINGASSGTSLAAWAKEALKKLYPSIPIMATELHYRQAYMQSHLAGKSVFEQNKASPASQEMGKLLIEINKIVKENTKAKKRQNKKTP